MDDPDFKKLRTKAERHLSPENPVAPQTFPQDMQKLMHELSAHRIELEVQKQELCKAQEESEKSRKKYADLYDFAPVGDFTLDNMGVVAEANLTGADLLGIERGRLLKVPFSSFVMAEDLDVFWEFKKKVHQAAGQESSELRLKRKAGDPIWVRLKGVAVEAPDGKLNGVRMALMDITEPKRADEALLFKENIIRCSSSAIATCGLEGSMTYGNPSFLTAWGFNDSQEFLGRPFWEFWAVEDMLDEIKRALRVDGTWFGEIKALRKDGSTFDVQVSAATVYDSGGKPIALTSTSIDITERKRVELALQESQALLQAVMANTSDPVYVKDRQGGILMCNPALAKVAGKPVTEIIGKTDSEYYGDPVIGKALRENDLRVMESGRSQIMEETVKTPDGPRIFISSKAPYRNESGDIIGILGISHDITERKRAEESLRASENAYRTLSENLPGLVYRVFIQENGRMQFFNSMLQAMTGYVTEELSAGEVCSIEPLIVSEDRTAVVDAVKRAILNNQPFEVEYRLRCKSGDIRYFLERGRPIFGNDEKPLYIDGVILDISERKVAEEALCRSRDELETRVRERTAELGKANEVLQHLSSKLLIAQEEERKRIAGELHDTIGSSLVSINYGIEGALMKSEEGKTVFTELLAKVIPSVKEAIEECRRIQLDLRPPMLDELGLLPTLSWFCRRYQESYEWTRVTKELSLEERDIPGSLKVVIYRIIQEAMNNIAKHSKASRVCLRAGKNRGRIEFAVEDNGKGFDPVEVLGSKKVRWGLGLTSMKERAEISGGTFDIKSREGKGTVIQASWPSFESS